MIRSMPAEMEIFRVYKLLSPVLVEAVEPAQYINKSFDD